MMRWRVPLKIIDYVVDWRLVTLLRPLQVKSKINSGRLPTCGVIVTGESHRFGKFEMVSSGETATLFV